MGICKSKIVGKRLIAHTNILASKLLSTMHDEDENEIIHLKHIPNKTCEILSKALKTTYRYCDCVLAGNRDCCDDLDKEELLIRTKGIFSNLYSDENNQGDTLILCNKSIIEITEEIIGLRHIAYIHACCNFITRIPAAMFMMNKVKYLVLSNNQITHLPDVFGGECNIVNLNMSSNKLKTLPKSFKNLKKLENLNINSNLFTDLPLCISGCKSLRSLEVNSNQLLSIPIEIIRLKRLSAIYCYNNMFVPDEELKYIQKIPTLRAISSSDFLRQSYAIKSIPILAKEYLKNSVDCSFCGNPCFEGGYEYIDMQVFVFEKLPVKYNLCKKHFSNKREKIIMTIQRN